MIFAHGNIRDIAPVRSVQRTVCRHNRAIFLQGSSCFIISADLYCIAQLACVYSAMACDLAVTVQIQGILAAKHQAVGRANRQSGRGTAAFECNQQNGKHCHCGNAASQHKHGFTFLQRLLLFYCLPGTRSLLDFLFILLVPIFILIIFVRGIFGFTLFGQIIRIHNFGSTKIFVLILIQNGGWTVIHCIQLLGSSHAIIFLERNGGTLFQIIDIWHHKCHGIVQQCRYVNMVKGCQCLQMHDVRDTIAIFPIHIFCHRHKQPFGNFRLRQSTVFPQQVQFLWKLVHSDPPCPIFYVHSIFFSTKCRVCPLFQQNLIT